MAEQAKGAEIPRRGFLQGASAAAALSVVPRSALGGPGRTPPSERINVGFVGVGAQGLRVMLSFLPHADVQGVAVCDPMPQADDYPQWGRNEYRDKVHQLLGVSTGWEWLSPNKPIQLTRTMQSAGGVAGRDPARKIVEAYYATKRGQSGYRCRAYADYREMLEAEKDMDAIVIGTPDHLHAPVAVAAMRRAKHVFCQKPMAHDIYEARRMAEVAREKGAATQVAVGNAASEDTRRLCEWVWSGAIGPVRQVINWSSRPFWPQGIDRPRETPAVPAGFDWDLWLGPAPERPYHPAYLPFVWRGWYDFGCGALGDMGCYSLDTIFRVLKLGPPSTVEASSSERWPETFPQASIVRWTFPARGDMPPVDLTWYDGGLLPRRPDELGPAGELESEGLLFVGDRGRILCGFTGGNPRILPESRRRELPEPPKTLPRSIGHEREWIEACKGGSARPGADFEFSARVTEALLLGNVALQSGKRVVWDSAGLKAVNQNVDTLVRRPARAGWGV